MEEITTASPSSGIGRPFSRIKSAHILALNNEKSIAEAALPSLDRFQISVLGVDCTDGSYVILVKFPTGRPHLNTFRYPFTASAAQ